MATSSIKPKKGFCIDCPEDSPEVFLTAKRCHNHYWKHRANVKAGDEVINKVASAKRSPISKVSAKQMKLNSQCLRLRLNFLAKRFNCEAKVKCLGSAATEVHHLRGRGEYFLRTDTWLPVCSNCHHWCHDNDAEAREKGLLLSRLEKIQ